MQHSEPSFSPEFIPDTTEIPSIKARICNIVLLKKSQLESVPFWFSFHKKGSLTLDRFIKEKKAIHILDQVEAQGISDEPPVLVCLNQNTTNEASTIYFIAPPPTFDDDSWWDNLCTIAKMWKIDHLGFYVSPKQFNSETHRHFIAKLVENIASLTLIEQLYLLHDKTTFLDTMNTCLATCEKLRQRDIHCAITH